MRLTARLSPTRTPLLAGLLALPLLLSGCAGDDNADTEGSTSSASATSTTSASATASTSDATSDATESTATTATSDATATDPTSTTDPTATTDETSSTAPTSTTDDPTTTTGDTTTTTTTGDPLHPVVTLETNLGDIVLELDAELAPITTENFLVYVDNGFYDGEDGNGATIFHRVINGFMMQGGGHIENLSQKSTLPPIVNESGNGLTNIRGSIAMARTPDPDSATSQFFINFVDNLFLDDPPGYAVFGQVIEGIEVVDAVAEINTNAMDVPLETVTILDAYQN